MDLSPPSGINTTPSLEASRPQPAALAVDSYKHATLLWPLRLFDMSAWSSGVAKSWRRCRHVDILNRVDRLWGRSFGAVLRQAILVCTDAAMLAHGPLRLKPDMP